jgi:hypothetical protein
MASIKTIPPRVIKGDNKGAAGAWFAACPGGLNAPLDRNEKDIQWNLISTNSRRYKSVPAFGMKFN